MANISTLLARILTTRYGRDMRQDLHDAIEAVNDDTETALGKKLTFTNNTRKLKLLAKDDSVLSEVVIPGGGSGGGSVDSVNGLFPDENGNVELNLDDINDVDITSVEDGDALVYDSTSGKWVNGAGGGGGTTDYTDLSNKPSINGVTLSGNKTSADLGIFAPTITSPTSGQVIKYDGSNWVNGSVSGGSNRNLLDNPWFTVNQRGFSSGSAAQNSTPIDRWQVRFNATTLALVSSGLNITNTTDNHGLVQILDMPTDYVNTYTFSMLTSDGNIYTKTGKFQTDTSGQTQVISSPFPVYMGLWTIGGKLAPAVYLSGNSSTASLTITAMKLELGTESTLALDTAPDYASELLKCQRYYIPLPRYWNGLTAGINGTYHLVNISLPTKMRTTPTLSGSAYIEGALSGSTVSETIATSSMTVRNADSQFIQIEVQGSNQFDKNGNVIFIPSSGAALSAEL